MTQNRFISMIAHRLVTRHVISHGSLSLSFSLAHLTLHLICIRERYIRSKARCWMIIVVIPKWIPFVVVTNILKSQSIYPIRQSWRLIKRSILIQHQFSNEFRCCFKIRRIVYSSCKILIRQVWITHDAKTLKLNVIVN